MNKGAELSFAGDLTHGLHALLSASFIHPRQHSTQDPSTEGKSPSSIPGASERVNLSWDVPYLRRLVLSCNLMQNGSAAFDATDRFRVPSWTRLDLGARYSFGEKRPLTIRAEVENVADGRYWASAFSGGLTPSGPRVREYFDIEGILREHSHEPFSTPRPVAPDARHWVAYYGATEIVRVAE